MVAAEVLSTGGITAILTRTSYIMSTLLELKHFHIYKSY